MMATAAHSSAQPRGIAGSDERSSSDVHVSVYDMLSGGEAKDISGGQTAGSSSSAASGTLSPPPEFLKSPTPSVIRRLKSSLKLAKSHSTSSVTTTSSTGSSQKNVRFAAELTTVKQFDSDAEPISISNENSPTLTALLSPSDFYHKTATLGHNLCSEEDFYSDHCDDGFWFNQLPTLKKLRNGRKHQQGSGARCLTGFKLKGYRNSGHDYDYDSESSLESDSESDSDSNEDEDFSGGFHGEASSYANGGDNAKFFELLNWKLVNSNVTAFKNRHSNPFITQRNYTLDNTDSDNDIENQIFEFLQGSNIRLHSLKQPAKDDTGKIVGLIYVNNLNFEKFIEIKFTFNYWKDIHYVTAFYSKSITQRIDEFQFVIDLNSLKYSLRVKNLIFAKKNSSKTVCRLNAELCCRYDVNNETFYDNNNYENYQVELIATTKPLISQYNEDAISETKSEPVVSFSKPLKRTSVVKDGEVGSFANNFLISTTLSHNPGSFSSSKMTSRRFNEDTDYYNTSPLKHLYHNDTSYIRPVRLNQVLLNPDLEFTDEEESIENNSISIEQTKKQKEEKSTVEEPIILTSGTVMDSSSGSLSSMNSQLTSSTTSSLSSSSSGGYSPLEDFQSSEYYPSSSYDSISSFDLAQFNHLPPLSSLGSAVVNNENIDNASGHFMSNNYSNSTIIDNYRGDLSDDRQSVTTDVVDQGININNSTETLINPNLRPLSSISTESDFNQGDSTIIRPSANAVQRSIIDDDSTGHDNKKLNTDQKDHESSDIFSRSWSPSNSKKGKDIDYQSFISSYCFYSPPTKRTFDNNKFAPTPMLPLESSPHRRTLPLNICKNNNNSHFDGNRSNHPLSFSSDNVDLFGTSPPILSQGTHWSL